jgi:aspartyl-tRNA(Asn)/glutamyl-tRNA(Gln) amidotransferase subunit C
MSAADKIDVRYVANLARLKLTNEEVSLFQGQLAGILDYMSNLSETKIETNVDAAPASNELREDVAKDWFTAEEALSNAPRQRDHLFIVPKVVE